MQASLHEAVKLLIECLRWTIKLVLPFIFISFDLYVFQVFLTIWINTKLISICYGLILADIYPKLTFIHSDIYSNDSFGFTVSVGTQVLIILKCMKIGFASAAQKTASSRHVDNKN